MEEKRLHLSLWSDHGIVNSNRKGPGHGNYVKRVQRVHGVGGREGTAEFQDWWDGHQHLCQANCFGSSGSMDASGMLSIFQRSVEAHCFRYTEFLGDGDSKSHKLIVEQAVYGEVEVTKLECVGHIQKRLGSRLRSLKKRLGQTRLEDGSVQLKKHILAWQWWN